MSLEERVALYLFAAEKEREAEKFKERKSRGSRKLSSLQLPSIEVSAPFSSNLL